MTELWCYIEGKRDYFGVTISPKSTIDNLKTEIYNKYVDVDLNEVDRKLDRGEYQLDANDQRRLRPREKISEVWPESPSNSQLHIFVNLSGGVGSPNLVYVGGKPPDSNFVREYEDFFIKAKQWGAFEGSDIEGNGLRSNVHGTVPDFVVEFERELDDKPGLDPDVYDFFKSIRDAQSLGAYFGPIKRGTVEDVSQEEFTFEGESQRLAGYLEVAHLAHIASLDWEIFWNGKLGRTLEEPLMNTIFFHPFAGAAFQSGSSTTVLTGKQPWPIHLIMKCEPISDEKEQLGKFRPRSDLLVSKSSLPRLLVEVNSKPKKDRPEDLVRMLLTGAAIVRFANRFLDRFMVFKNFVLCAMYVWDSGEVSRYSLYREFNNSEVRWKETSYRLDTSVDRAEFVRQLYNLLHMLEREEVTGDTGAKMRQLQKSIEKHNKEHPMQSFNTKDTPGTNNPQGNKRRRGDDGGGGAGETDSAELGAHGYEVEPRDLVDENGIVMESLSDMPSHILTVYQRSDPGKRFIAKKVHKESNELKIFELLNTFQLKSEHIISLHESFQTQSTSWAILPKIISLVGGQLHGKVAQVCWGLIKGVAYLHKFCIAHRDIKPENLVVDWGFCLKIIDFDYAMEVIDEDEVVNGQCGTKGWMAPETEKSMYSPIRADRWSTGRVLLYFLNKFRKEDTVLRTIALKLTTHNPELRSSMLQVAASLSDAANVAVGRKATRSLQDTVEVDGENAMPPRVKKQKLSEPERGVLAELPSRQGQIP